MGNLFRIRGFFPYILMIFLNAFVDLGHKITIQNTVFKTYDGDALIILTAIVNSLILLPFILLFTPSGFLADKYPKNKVMLVTAWGAVGLTSLITLFYYIGWFWVAFCMTFLLAVQSAFYSPAKYGYIKEIVGKERLARGNGVVQATTTIAILAGTFVFSILFEMYLADVIFSTKQDVLQVIAPIGWFLIAGAIVELFLAYRLPDTQELDESMRFDWSKYRTGHYFADNIKAVKSHEVIFLSIIGLAIFWAIGQVLLAAFPAFAKDNLGVLDTRIIQGMLACAGIGIMFGSIIAGKVSKNYIETGLIPIGSLGVATCLFILPGLESVPAHGLNILLLGMLGGIFIIPLNALIQFHAGEHILGRVLAGNNLIQNIVMLSFLILTVVFSLVEISNLLFILLTVVALAGGFYTVYKLPQSLVRFIVTSAIGLRYRLEVLGFRNIPETGGVLMLGNHVSWIDWAIIQMAAPRPIRFVMEKGIYRKWYLKRFFDLFEVIPIAGGASKSTLKTIAELISAGEVVCLFPEGTLSRSGQLTEFHHGYEKAAEAVVASGGVILPFYLRGLWGTRFSRAGDRLKTIRATGGKHHIIIEFGKPLPMDTKADELKQRIFDLSITTWNRYVETLEPLSYAFMDTVKRLPAEIAVADSTGKPVSYKKIAVASACFSRFVKKHSKGQNIGILLPTGSDGAIVNMAGLMAGKTLVNLDHTASPEALLSAVTKAEIDSVYTSTAFLKKPEQRDRGLAPLLSGLNVCYMEELEQEIATTAKLITLACMSLFPAWLLKKWYCRHVGLDSTAAILFSGGDEGEPGGVMLSQRNLMANVKQISDVLNTQSNDVVMATLPLFHAFGLTVTTLMPLIEGVSMVCHPDPTDAVNVARTVAKYKATILFSASAFLRLYTEDKRVHPLMFESLRLVIADAEKLDTSVRDAFKLKFNKDVLEGYGATETSPVASVNVPDHLDSRYWKVQSGTKPGTVGLPLPGSSFRIVDPETLQQSATGEDGLILIGGAQVMSGYLKDEAKTNEVIVKIDNKRWYKTGDKGHLDEDGFLTIVARRSHSAKPDDKQG